MRDYLYEVVMCPLLCLFGLGIMELLKDERYIEMVFVLGILGLVESLIWQKVNKAH